MDSPRRAASEASEQRDVARIVAQNVSSKSTPGRRSLAYERPSGRDVGAVDGFPAVVVGVIHNFGSLGRCPSSAVITESLLPGFWVRAGGGGDERAG
eukprot:1077861-Pleurochrysis_carterae.AAC.1